MSSHPDRPTRIPPTWVTQVLELEQSDVRFEAFANELVSALEGQAVVGTSRSWDLGRDGRGYGPRRGVHVLTTLGNDPSKPRDDAARLKSGRMPIRRIYYVAPRIVSESVLEDHCRAIQTVLGDNVLIDPLGRTQIVDLVSTARDGEAFSCHYRGELASIANALARDAVEPQSKHLELALCTFGAKDTHDLRVALSSRLILGLLQQESMNVECLADGAASVLGVPAFSRSTVQHYCNGLEQRGHIRKHDSLYEITEAGRQAFAEGDAGIVESELSGREAVRRAVEESLGDSIPEQQWVLIWKDLQSGVANAFYVRGKQVLDVISNLLGGDTSATQRDILASLVDDVVRKVTEEHVGPPRRTHLTRALRDAFLPGDKHGAFEWLAGVAGRFAATCTLGLSPDVLLALSQTLKKIRFFADTDVIVSYLCAHEPSNAAATAIVELSRRLGNRILITDAVTEEVARHAMKAYTDYRMRVAPISGHLEWWEIADLESAFTREFEYLRAERRVQPTQWPRFIGRYAESDGRGYGRQRPDTTRMRNLLSAEGFGICGPEEQDAAWRERRDIIKNIMFDEARQRHPEERPDVRENKSRIDAEMLITVADTIGESQKEGAGERFILISSAKRLKRLPSGVGTRLRGVPEVISLAEAAAVAALLPDEAISLRALHAFLFEEYIGRTLRGLEAVLLRIVRESSSVVLPGATRGVLQEEFASAIMRESRLTGERPSEVRQRIEHKPLEFARVAGVAIDALAIRRPLDREDVLERLQDLISEE